MLRIRTRDWGSKGPITYFHKLDSWLFTGQKIGSPIPISVGQRAGQYGWATLLETSQRHVLLADWRVKRTKTVYLAQPYSHPDPAVMEYRYRMAIKASNYITLSHPEVLLFSPIVNSKPVADLGHLDHGWDSWGPIDLGWIDKCDEVWVLSIDGQLESKGLQTELRYARMLQKEIRHVNAEGHIKA